MSNSKINIKNLEEVKNSLNSKSLKVCVIGIGRIGLPTALSFANSGLHTVGVDINPNSVKICRLRLWIELLKNAYYTQENRLQTLPNIDINIKCGNSLISRFNLEDDLKDAFKNKEINYSFLDYKNAVLEYKQTNSKERKRAVLEIIE
mgnify:CR=1 FL=1